MANRASTPPPTSTIHTPPTPKHGWSDKYEPYSPRKSTRISARQLQRATKTPPPQESHRGFGTSRASPPTTIKRTSTNMLASPPSTVAKKRTSPTKSRARAGALNGDSMASTAATQGVHSKKSEVEARRSATTIRGHGMLPTPDKTPRKRTIQATPDISAIARNLFPIRPETIDEVMPSSKKNKKHAAFTLDDSSVHEDAPIAIYTDSQDRIPEVDASADNPFYGGGAAIPEPAKRMSKRRKISIPGEGEQTLEEAKKRTDGMIYVFRGKKIFRKFTDDDGTSFQQLHDVSEDELDEELDVTVPARLRGPLTRSSIKPRLLFPTAEQTARKEKAAHLLDDDEEAVTDIEESNDFTTPVDLTQKPVATPKAPKFAPASPPTTGRTTRSRKIEFNSPSGPDEDNSEDSAARDRSGNVSPFNSWRRTKSGAPGQSKKREGGSITRSGDLTKRQRGGQAVDQM